MYQHFIFMAFMALHIYVPFGIYLANIVNKQIIDAGGETMKPTIRIMSNTDIENIHQCTLDILSKTGIVFNSPEAIAIFQENGARIEGKKVFLPRNLIETSLKTVPSHFSLHGRNPEKDVEIGAGKIICAPACGPIYIYENETGKREAASEDYLNFVKLTHQSDFLDVNGDGILYPHDIPTQLFHRYVLFTTIKHSDKPLMGLTTGTRVSRECIEMAQIAMNGQHENIILGMANVNSPLYYDENMADGIIEYARWKQPIGIACCGMAGFTAPVTMAGMLAINNAEILSGIILSQLVNPGTPVIYGNTSTVASMKTMGLILGAPETSIIISAAAQLAKFYKIPFRSGGGLTGASSNNIQAGYESMMSLFTTYLGETDFVLHAAGILNNFSSISYEKFIIDEEIGQMIHRYMRGIEVNPDTLAYETIQEIGPCGNYLVSDHTIDHFKSELWEPLLSNQKDNSDILHMAQNICKKRLEQYIKPDLEEKTEAKLADYYQRGL